MTQGGKDGVGSMGGLLDQIHVEEVECLGICLEPRGSRMSWYSLKTLGFKAKCFCWVMGFTVCMTSHQPIVEQCEYLDPNIR